MIIQQKKGVVNMNSLEYENAEYFGIGATEGQDDKECDCCHNDIYIEDLYTDGTYYICEDCIKENINKYIATEYFNSLDTDKQSYFLLNDYMQSQGEMSDKLFWLIKQDFLVNATHSDYETLYNHIFDTDFSHYVDWLKKNNYLKEIAR